MIDESKVYKIKEAAEASNSSVTTLRRRIKEGRLRRVSRANEDIRILGSDLIRFVNGEK